MTTYSKFDSNFYFNPGSTFIPPKGTKCPFSEEGPDVEKPFLVQFTYLQQQLIGPDGYPHCPSVGGT